MLIFMTVKHMLENPSSVSGALPEMTGVIGMGRTYGNGDSRLWKGNEQIHSKESKPRNKGEARKIAVMSRRSDILSCLVFGWTLCVG